MAKKRKTLPKEIKGLLEQGEMEGYRGFSQRKLGKGITFEM